MRTVQEILAESPDEAIKVLRERYSSNPPPQIEIWRALVIYWRANGFRVGADEMAEAIKCIEKLEASVLKVPSAPPEPSEGWWWATNNWSHLKEIVYVGADGSGNISGTEEPYNLDKFKRSYTFICRIPEPS